MKKLKRMVSLKKRPSLEEPSAEPEVGRTGPAPKTVVFELGAAEPVAKREPTVKRPNLQRTKSRSVECLKSAESRYLLKRSVLRSRHHREDYQPSDSESSLGSFSGWAGRSQSYYAFRPGQHRNSPAMTPEGSTGSLAKAGRHVRSPSCYQGGLAQQQQATFRRGATRCGSTPPQGARNSLTNIYGSAAIRMIPDSLMDKDVIFRSSLNVLQPLPQLQSEENLMLDLQRKQEKTWMNQSRLREETSIIQNIKKRELIEMKKKEMKPIIVKELKEVKKKSTIPLILIPSSDHKSNGKKRSIVSGLLGTRTILLAPTAAALIDPSEKKNARVTSTVTPPDPKQLEKEKLENWVPPPIEKPRERQLVRHFIKSIFSSDEEAPAVTKFTESDFTQDCLFWHNHFREKHRAPPLVLDEQLCATAQFWANILAHRDELFHENPDEVGENLFAWPIPVVPDSQVAKKCADVTGKDVSMYWYNTMSSVYFEKSSQVQHAFAGQFSQMLWASSESFGCGKARSRSGKVIVVARYFPKGNIAGRFHLNVFPLVDDDGEEVVDGVDDKELSKQEDRRSQCC